MKRPNCAANCDGSKRRWPIRIWNWCWSRRSWRWPVRNWTRAWRSLKKSTLAGGAPGGRNRPAVEGDPAVSVGAHERAELLRASPGLVPAASRCAIGAGTGAGAARASTATGGEKALPPDPGGTASGGSQDGARSPLWRTAQSRIAGGKKTFGLAQNHAVGPSAAGVQEPDPTLLGERPQPGLGGGHHLHPDARGVSVFGSDHR